MRGGEGARAPTSATRGRRCHGADAGFGLGRWAPRRNALQVADGLTRGGPQETNGLNLGKMCKLTRFPS